MMLRSKEFGMSIKELLELSHMTVIERFDAMRKQRPIMSPFDWVVAAIYLGGIVLMIHYVIYGR